MALFPGARRLVAIDIEEINELPAALLLRLFVSSPGDCAKARATETACVKEEVLSVGSMLSMASFSFCLSSLKLQTTTAVSSKAITIA